MTSTVVWRVCLLAVAALPRTSEINAAAAAADEALLKDNIANASTLLTAAVTLRHTDKV